MKSGEQTENTQITDNGAFNHKMTFPIEKSDQKILIEVWNKGFLMTNFVGQNLMEVETMQDQILKEITVEIKDNKDKKVGELVLRGIWV